MKRYRATGVITGGKYLGEVEAENAEEAMEKAWDLPDTYVSLCHQCSHKVGEISIEEIEVEEIQP